MVLLNSFGIRWNCEGWYVHDINFILRPMVESVGAGAVYQPSLFPIRLRDKMPMLRTVFFVTTQCLDLRAAVNSNATKSYEEYQSYRRRCMKLYTVERIADAC